MLVVFIETPVSPASTLSSGSLFTTGANMRRLSVTYLLSSSISFASASTPYLVAWNSTRSYGPDGPWPVVTVRIGTDAHGGGVNTVDLHPGGIWQHMILVDKFCK